MFFESFQALGRVMLSALIVYVAIVILLRLMGKRASSKMNAFDWAVTVAIGSMIASTILMEEVTVLDGVVGIATLHILQYALSWLSVRFDAVKTAIKASPCLLMYHGKYLDKVMQRERVTREDILTAVRQQGIAGIDDVLAVILETNAELTVVEKKANQKNESAIENVTRPSG